jgi:hypothetical protein
MPPERRLVEHLVKAGDLLLEALDGVPQRSRDVLKVVDVAGRRRAGGALAAREALHPDCV